MEAPIWAVLGPILMILSNLLDRTQTTTTCEKTDTQSNSPNGAGALSAQLPQLPARQQQRLKRPLLTFLVAVGQENTFGQQGGLLLAP